MCDLSIWIFKSSDGGASSSLEDLTPEDQQNLGLQIILKEEEPEHDDYLCKPAGHARESV